ncbi:MAG: aminodeoxychorismate/anthranilate synthase component II [Hyphomicrobiales bacterium]|nr:aminodeoxychorismate/anthranilate synthase component II [Hyphomicrobiales bacterium]
MILIIDNYDSFTYNIVQYIGDLGFETNTIRNDSIAVDEVHKSTSHIIISPGPCTPDKAGISVELVKKYYDKIPILGICLGHQSIAQAFGSKIVKAAMPMHGKVDVIKHTGSSIYNNVPEKFEATRYHSLIINEKSLSKDLIITSRSLTDNYIMSINHKETPTFGVQFHPESIASEYGYQIMKNFLSLN